MDYGKYKYEQQKKANEARKKQKVIEIKEIKMRPTIDDHDYDVKMRAMKRFFDEGDKVKVTLRFRGREMAHQHLGMELLNRVKNDTEDRQGRAGPELRRPPDDDGSGAAIGRKPFRRRHIIMLAGSEPGIHSPLRRCRRLSRPATHPRLPAPHSSPRPIDRDQPRWPPVRSASGRRSQMI